MRRLVRGEHVTASIVGDGCRLVVVVLAGAAVSLWPLETLIRLALLAGLLAVLRGLAVPPVLDALTTVLLTAATVAGAVGAYRWIWWLDDVAHGVVVGISSLALALALTDVTVRRRPQAALDRLPLAVVTTTLGLALASCWELYEWASTRMIGGGTIQVGYDDTMSDIALGASGAVLLGCVSAMSSRRTRTRPQLASRHLP